MGGYGSGRYQAASAKDTVEDTIILNIFKLYREGIITWGKACSGTFTGGKSTMSFTLAHNVLTLFYSFSSGTHKGQSVQYPIRIEETHPHYGGRRLWWLCPGCERRCGKLYLAPGQLYYLCRGCAQLTYQSTRELTLQKVFARSQAIDRRIARLYKKYGKPTGASDKP